MPVLKNMSVAFWAARKRQKKNARLEFQLKDPNTFLFKTRYVSNHDCFEPFTCVSRCNYEVDKGELPRVFNIAAENDFEIVPVPDYVEAALAFDVNHAFDEAFTETEIWKKMFDFQKEGVRAVVTRFGGRAIIGDEMGLGKTLQALALCKYYKHKRVLVICPAYLRYNWEAEIKKWIGEWTNIIMIKKGTDDIDDEDGFVITSYELATKKKDDLKRLKYQMAVVDESHYLKGHRTKRTRGLTPVLKKMTHTILLTGTPCLNRPCELFSQAHIVRPEYFKKWRPYTKRYCDGQMSPLGFYEFGGKSNQSELHWLSKQTVMIRRMKKDVLKDLPPKIRTQMYLPTPPGKSRPLKPLFQEWKQINKEIRTMVPCSKEIKEAAFRRKTIIGQLFLKTGEAKLSAVQTVIKDLVAQDVKFIVFAYHMSFMDGICETLAASNTTYMRIDGSTSLEKRNEYVDDFQNGKIQVAVLSLLAASTGLTLTACSTLLFAQLYYVPGVMAQAEDRINRIGATQTSDIRYLIAKDTLDEHLYKMLNWKLETLHNLLDGQHEEGLDGLTVDLENDYKLTS